MSFYIDLTELITNPRRTGIERIGGEICKYLPPNSAIPVRLHSGRYIAYPRALIDAIGGYFCDADASGVNEIRKLGAIENGSAIDVSEGDTVLVPEIFGEERSVFFRRMSDEELRRYRFIIYDLLPLTHPEYFLPDMPLLMHGYYNVVRRASHCGFISEYTRQAYYTRLKRTDSLGGIVLPLGSDSLGPRIEQPALNRSLTFSVLGTIEPRKNHKLILEAFEPFLRQVTGLQLVFIGKLGFVDSEFAQKVQTMSSDENSGLRLVSTPDDDTIRGCIERSRATIYMSIAEGYGLPPVESLWLGSPVIGSRMIPSLQGLGSGGVHYVDPLSAINLRRAALAFLDDDYANQKAQETAHLKLPTWQSFTQEVLCWCGQGAAVGKPSA